MNCTAGHTYFVIPPSGKVWRCWAHQREVYGSVSDLTLRAADSSPPCPELRCRMCERQCNVVHYDNGNVAHGSGSSRDAKHLVFRVMPILECNYTCPYCITETRNNRLFDVPRPERRIIPASSWSTWWAFIKQRCERCDVYISGGEPTIYPGFDEFIQAVDRLPGRHWLATNLSRPVRSLEEGQVKRFWVEASAHLTDPKFNQAEFLERARKVANHVPFSIKVIQGHASHDDFTRLQIEARRMHLRLYMSADQQDRRRPPVTAAFRAPDPLTTD